MIGKSKTTITTIIIIIIIIIVNRTYRVSIGVSWGDLPYNLQQKWLEYSCDYHMSDSSESLTGLTTTATTTGGPSHNPTSSPSSLEPTSSRI